MTEGVVPETFREVLREHLCNPAHLLVSQMSNLRLSEAKSLQLLSRDARPDGKLIVPIQHLVLLMICALDIDTLLKQEQSSELVCVSPFSQVFSETNDLLEDACCCILWC